MAKRRMISIDITDADKFTDLSVESQALYFHLNLNADDEGFVASPNKTLKMMGLTRAHMDELTGGGFIIIFKSGICLITHWHIHNYIRKDRLTPTIYTEEKEQVVIDDRKVYVMDCAAKKPCKNACQADVRQMSAQEREGKDRIGKVSVGEERAEDKREALPERKLAELLDDKKYSFPYKLTPKSLSEYTKKMDFECIRYALEEANISQKCSLGYVRAVLDRLLREGITTKDMLRNQIRNRNGPKKEQILSHGYTQEDMDKLQERMEEL